jgi:endo-1,4-beta-D-glucanase Y
MIVILVRLMFGKNSMKNKKTFKNIWNFEKNSLTLHSENGKLIHYDCIL